jgi:hypothetical protein
MSTLLGPLAAIALTAMCGWVLGSLVLRAGGLFLVVAALLTLATGGGVLAGLGGLTLGTAAWLAGHWLYGYRHHEYRSPLAARVFRHALRRLDPIRR